MGRVFMSGIVPQKVAPITFKPNFADNDWSTIIKACQTNKVPDTWTVGSQKIMTINGTDYVIDIIGKNHDDYADGSGKAPLTFQMHDCYKATYQIHNAINQNIGWNACDMRNTHLPIILALMPIEVQNGIKEVTKYAGGTMYAGASASTDKLFLLSTIEVAGENGLQYATTGEGTQYDYYKAGNSSIKMFDGSARAWWTRSRNATSDSYWCVINAAGQARYMSEHTTMHGVAFAFCF